MKTTGVVAIAALSSVLGGMVGAYTMKRFVGRRTEMVIRAHKFELVGDDGKVVSLWGVDKDQNTVLAFRGSRQGNHHQGDASLNEGLDDPLNQEVALGMVASNPSMLFRGIDGHLRTRMYVDPWKKPSLLMSDETGVRLTLGIHHTDTPTAEDNDWMLSFQPDRAWIGMFSRIEAGQRYVRGFTSVSEDKVKYPYDQPQK